MSTVMSLSLCLSDIDKTKITTGTNGKLYLNITVGTKDEKDKYGKDVSAWHSQTKEQRTAEEKRVYLGNGEVLWKSETAGGRPSTDDEKGDLPF
jgi:hypothetical protein